MITALVRLVEIGRLRNGRPVYLPEPEHRIIELAAAEDAYDMEDDDFADRPGLVSLPSFLRWRARRYAITNEIFAAFVAAHQRVSDAITTGAPLPFDARELPTWAALMRG